MLWCITLQLKISVRQTKDKIIKQNDSFGNVFIQMMMEMGFCGQNSGNCLKLK